MKIFVSTPSEDLKDIRAAICKILDEEDITPFSMELLYASARPPWNELTEKIDQVDYLLLVVGDEYGSKDKEGIGYTEKEFNYAEARGIPVLAFLKEFDEKGENNKTEIAKFKKKVSDDDRRTVSFWNKIEEIIPCVLGTVKKIKAGKEKELKDETLKSNITNESNDKKNGLIELAKFYPEYPIRPIGSCAVTFKKRELSDIVISFNHTEIMDIFRFLNRWGSLETVGYDGNRAICQIGSFRLYLEQDEKISLEKAFIEYKSNYLNILKKITIFLQTDNFSGSDKRKFAYRIVKVNHILTRMIERMDEIKFIEKYRNFYS